MPLPACLPACLLGRPQKQRFDEIRAEVERAASELHELQAKYKAKLKKKRDISERIVAEKEDRGLTGEKKEVGR